MPPSTTETYVSSNVSSMMSLITIATWGVNSEGLTIAVFPAAIAPMRGSKTNWTG